MGSDKPSNNEGFDHRHYVPCLRWKQGEYQGLLKLSERVKDSITPLIEVQERGWDFENQQDAKTLEKHIEKFATRIANKWESRPCFVDLIHILDEGNLKDGAHPAKRIFDELVQMNCDAIPVIRTNRSTAEQAVFRGIIKKRHRACVRVSLEELAQKAFASQLSSLLLDVGIVASECDFIFDLGTPSFQPLEGFSKLVANLICKIPEWEDWQSVTLIGTSFPSTMAEVEYGLTFIPRQEWELYGLVVKKLRSLHRRLPAFGDYAINHPEVNQMDMRFVKPNATIRYTTDADWLIVKGKNVRDYKFEQFREHCNTVVSTSDFMGSEYSEADRYIAGCAAGSEKTGNLTTWRWVGTNHHLTKVVEDIANLFGS